MLKVDHNWTCQECGRVTARLAVHHVKPIETGKTEEEMERLCFDRDNLQVLCYDCHARCHQNARSHSAEVVQKRAADRINRTLQELGLCQEK